jgi:hypothetical protein
MAAAAYLLMMMEEEEKIKKEEEEKKKEGKEKPTKIVSKKVHVIARNSEKPIVRVGRNETSPTIDPHCCVIT